MQHINYIYIYAAQTQFVDSYVLLFCKGSMAAANSIVLSRHYTTIKPLIFSKMHWRTFMNVFKLLKKPWVRTFILTAAITIKMAHNKTL